MEHMDIGHKSDIGKVRTVNQDAYLIMEDKENRILILAVADGLGGHKAGEVASNTLIDGLKANLDIENILSDNPIDEVKIINVVKKLNEKIYQMGNDNIEYNRMGTTLSLAIIIKDMVYIFHIGDSRIYIVNEENIFQITKDHSLVEQLISEGEISKEEAQKHPNKNVLTRAIGTDETIEVDFYKYQLKQNDHILLCTDGLSNLLGEDEIKKIILENTCEEAANLLVQKAKELGGHDNITVIVYKPEVIL